MVCSVSSCIVTEYIRLDYKIRCQIFGHFSPIGKAMQKCRHLGNVTSLHAIPNERYDVYIEENIMVLARICGNEDQTRVALDDAQKRPCDEAPIDVKNMIKIFERNQRDQEMKEVCRVIFKKKCTVLNATFRKIFQLCSGGQFYW